MIRFKCKVKNRTHEPICKIFINMYLQEVRQLVKRGIKSSYVGVEDNLNFYKGKLLVNEHIKRNTVHQERFLC